MIVPKCSIVDLTLQYIFVGWSRLRGRYRPTNMLAVVEFLAIFMEVKSVYQILQNEV